MSLLYDEGFTINGARKKLRQKSEHNSFGSSSAKEKIELTIIELKEVLEILNPD